MLRLLAGLGAFALVAFVAMVLWLRYVALPNVEDYRGDIVASLERASGMDVGIRRLQGGWDGLRPSLTLEGFTLADRKGASALRVERAEATLSWWSLLSGEVRFESVELQGPELVLRRGADGLIYLADKALNRAGPDDGRFSQWLLGQPRFQVHDATLVWRDEKAGAPEVRLTQVEIAVRREHGAHRALLTAVPPAHLAGRIELRAHVRFEREGEHWRGVGEFFGASQRIDLARLRTHLPVPDAMRSGVGAVRAWVTVGPGGIEEITGDVDLRSAHAQLSEASLPLELASVSGRAAYRVLPGGFQVGTENLRFRTAAGLEAKPGAFSVALTAPAGQAKQGEVKADGIDLRIAAALLDYFPVPRDVKAQVVRFAPRGTLAKATLKWTGETLAAATAFTLAGSFDDLAIAAVEGYPGASGLTGTLEGNEAGGKLRLASGKSTFEAANLFRAPLAFDALEANATWKRTGRALEVAIADARIANADAELRFQGTWRSLPDAKERSPGFADLRGTIARASMPAVSGYLPNRLEVTRAWLDRAIVAGSASNARFELKGDLWHFPFRDGSQGRFAVEGELHEGRLKYHPEWPSIDAIEGSIRIENARLEIHATRAAIFASRVQKVSAVIDDVMAKPPVVVVTGDIETAGTDAMRFLRESPLVNGPGAFTRAVTVEGPARLALRLDYPVYGTQPARVQGDYQFAGATASVGKALAMTGVKGRLQFTERGVRAPELTGSMFGQPALLRLASQPDNSVLTTIEGRIGVPVLGAYVPEAIAARLEGGLDWRARAVSNRDGTQLRIESDLKGLAVKLPEPFAKAGPEARPLVITIRDLGAETEAAFASLAGNIHGRFSSRGTGDAQSWQAAIRFGTPIASEPARDGVWLHGELPVLDLDAWQAVFPANPAAPGVHASPRGLELRGLDLTMGKLIFTQREFPQLHAKLQREGDAWSGQLASPTFAGEVSWSPEGRGLVRARLSRFALGPTREKIARAPEVLRTEWELPVLDIVAERFDFKGRELGRLEIAAEPEGADWRIRKLDIANGHAKFKSAGVWRRTATGSLTTLNVSVENNNLNALFAQFGYGDYLKRGQSKLDGVLVWPGLPNDFDLQQLSGSLKLEATRGQFARIEPGAGKLLGLLSLQSIPRRAILDFRDVFSDGFAFESITATVKVAKGILLTDDFEINGPSAFVSLVGEVSLPAETQALTMKVVPEVGEGIALAATVFGTPVLGLSTLLVSKLLQNPLGKAVAYEYLVTGSWDNPSVTRLSAPPPRAAAAPAVAPAKTNP